MSQAPQNPTQAVVTQGQAQAQQQAQGQAAFPSPAVLVQAARLALAQDKPILLDYYMDSATEKAFIGVDGKDEMLVKSREEFTSLIQKLYKVGADYIVMTENSIYLCNGAMKKRRIEASFLSRD